MSNYLDLLREFFVTDFKLRYKHSYLGVLWAIIKPLSYYVVLFTIWTSLFGNTVDFASYLLIGILVISYFSEGVQFGLGCLKYKQHIILKVNFSREIVIFSTIAIATVNFFINLAIYCIFRVSTDAPIFSENWGFFVLGFLMLTELLFGIAFFISIISIKLTDIKHLVELVLQLIFWATPVFYKLERLPERLGQILTIFNPLVIIMDIIRAGVFDDYTAPRWRYIIALNLFITVFTVCGYIFFKKSLPKLAEYF